MGQISSKDSLTEMLLQHIMFNPVKGCITVSVKPNKVSVMPTSKQSVFLFSWYSM